MQLISADGTHHTAAGDVDLADASNIKDNVNIFGVVGTMIGGASNCTDAGQIGCITTAVNRSTKNFRNTARSATATVVFDNTTSPLGGVGLDTYDTIDDYQNNTVATGLAPDLPWGAAFAASSSYWQDLTSDGSCDSGADQCVYQDKMTGLMWSADNTHMDFSSIAAASWPCGSDGCTQTSGNVTGGAGGVAAYAAGDNMNWWDSLYACNRLNVLGFNNYTSSWRLPTQKEMMEAYIHGIRAVTNIHWIDGQSIDRWSASTRSMTNTNAWYVTLVGGGTSGNAKTNTGFGFVCVR